LVLKVAWFTGGPQKKMRIQQQFHAPPEDSLDLLLAHAVKVVGTEMLPRHETEPPY